MIYSVHGGGGPAALGSGLRNTLGHGTEEEVNDQKNLTVPSWVCSPWADDFSLQHLLRFLPISNSNELGTQPITRMLAW